MSASADTPTSHGPTYGGSSTLPRIVNNFVHDMATGTWFACALVIGVVRSRIDGTSGDARAVLGDAMHAVFWLMLASLVALAVTGGLRLAYWRRDTPAEQLSAKRGALAVKHAVFLVVFGVGTAVAGWVAFR